MCNVHSYTHPNDCTFVEWFRAFVGYIQQYIYTVHIYKEKIFLIFLKYKYFPQGSASSFWGVYIDR